MPYSKLLMNTIADSEYTHKQIIDKLNEQNIKIDKSYLSKLVNNKLPAPRQEISRAIAKICNVDARALIIEGYFDKAPEEIKELLFNMKKYSAIYGIKNLKKSKKFTKQDIETIEERLMQEPIYDYILRLSDSFKEIDINSNNDNFSIKFSPKNITMELKDPYSFQIENDEMSPTIPKNSKVTLELLEEYKNGDIVALKDNHNIILRYYFENNGIITLNAIKNDIQPITGSKNNIKILGRVKSIITEL